MYAMDVDGHSAQELAAINGREDILRYLDQSTAKLENNDKYVLIIRSLICLCPVRNITVISFNEKL